MILFPDLLNLPRQLRHPEVRDLAWVILAPPMLEQTPWPQRHPLAGSAWVQAPDLIAALRKGLDHYGVIVIEEGRVIALLLGHDDKGLNGHFAFLCFFRMACLRRIIIGHFEM